MAGVDRKRLFFALWPDANGRGQLQGRTCDAVRLSRGHAIPAENFHVTLAFMGAVDRLEQQRLAAAAHAVKPFACAITMDRLEYWSGPRVLVATASEYPPELGQLYAELQAVLEASGFATAERPFRPHVTLARKAQVNPVEPYKSVTWSLKGFVLVESRPVAGGSQYSVLQGFAGAPPGAVRSPA